MWGRGTQNIGPAVSQCSYLKKQKILQVAKASEAQATTGGGGIGPAAF